MEYSDKIKNAFKYAIENNYAIFDKQIKVRKRFLEAKNVCFWGTGEFFDDCYGHPGFSFDYVCDNDPKKWGQYFKGKECISVEKLKSLKDVVVLIMVGNYIPIQEQLNNLNIENYCCDDIFLNVFDYKYDKAWFKGNLECALQALEIFEDDASKEVYTEAICNRIAPTYASKIFNQLKIPGEYFQQGIFGFEKNEIMIDAGAFDGDSALNFIETVGGEFEKIYAFEIEEDNYKRMQNKLHSYADKIEFINKGVYSSTMLVNFGGDKYGSHIDPNAQNVANVVSIDETVKGKRVTFIKMDIEGAEIKALEGAKETISKQTPKLAISAYHYLNDLWEIPLKIKKLNSKYKIYMRHHAPTVWDTDCYAYVE